MAHYPVEKEQRPILQDTLSQIAQTIDHPQPSQ